MRATLRAATNGVQRTLTLPAAAAQQGLVDALLQGNNAKDGGHVYQCASSLAAQFPMNCCSPPSLLSVSRAYTTQTPLHQTLPPLPAVKEVENALKEFSKFVSFHSFSKIDPAVNAAIRQYPDLGKFHRPYLQALAAFCHAELESHIHWHYKEPGKLKRSSNYVPILEKAIIGVIPWLPRMELPMLYKNILLSHENIQTLTKSGRAIDHTEIFYVVSNINHLSYAGNAEFVVESQSGGLQVANSCGLTPYYFLPSGTQLNFKRLVEAKFLPRHIPEGMGFERLDYPACTLLFNCIVPPPPTPPTS